ncbi:uncharacterized protein [Euphorbia lathyris]|uniref:uncharacterized protein isoform X2 n=1 Tax=Euphorbia lathyris TaxID=212925 RepID=UPI0033139EF6
MESLSEAELGEDCRECDMLGLLSVEEMRQQVLSFVTGSISLSQSLCSIQGCCTNCHVSIKSELRQPEAIRISAELKSKVHLEYLDVDADILVTSSYQVSLFFVFMP